MQITDTRFGLNEPVRIQFARYPNGQLALQLVTEDGEPWLIATSATAFPVPDGCIAVKNWSENDGVPDILVRGGVIEGVPLASVASGFVSVPIYRLTAAALAVAGALL